MTAKTMKAAVVHEFGQPLAIEEVSVPTAGPGQILVKIAASGVCHTDLAALRGGGPARSSRHFPSFRVMRASVTSWPQVPVSRTSRKVTASACLGFIRRV